MTSTLPEPSEETLGAALIAIRHARLPWYVRLVLREDSQARRAIARKTARRVEHRTRLLVAREIDTLDDPAWAEAISTVKQLILAKPAGSLVDRWWERLPAYSGAFAAACAKCDHRNGTRDRHTVLPTLFGPSPEFLARSCSHCGFEWRERCADSPEAHNGPQSGASEPGDAAQQPATESPAAPANSSADAEAA